MTGSPSRNWLSYEEGQWPSERFGYCQELGADLAVAPLDPADRTPVENESLTQ